MSFGDVLCMNIFPPKSLTNLFYILHRELTDGENWNLDVKAVNSLSPKSKKTIETSQFKNPVLNP